jgi:hypothetical protein
MHLQQIQYLTKRFSDNTYFTSPIIQNLQVFSQIAFELSFQSTTA